MIHQHPIVIFILIVFVSFSKINSRNSNELARIELVNAVSRPLLCGKGYFGVLEQKILHSFPKEYPTDPIRIPSFCQKFSGENYVSLNIFDARGVDMCSFTNAAALNFVNIFTRLNFLSAQNRFLVYNTTMGDIYSVPPPSDPIMDVYGATFIYIFVLSNYTLSLTLINSGPVILSQQEYVLSLINSFPKTSNQNVLMLTGESQMSYVASSLNSAQALTGFYNIFNSITDEFIINSLSTEALTLLILFWFTLLISSPENKIPLNATQTRFVFDQGIDYIKTLLGAASRANNLALPFINNVIQDGNCYWSFQYFTPAAVFYRIVLSQPMGMLMFKKK